MRLTDAVRRLPLDDLAPLAEIVGGARVVAIGENNHHIREFGLLRDRILRFLVTELGFGVLAFESGFAEGHLVDGWIRGASGDVATVGRDGFTFRFGEPAEVQDMLGWLRRHNAGGGRVRFAGLDVPGSGGDGLSALLRVRGHLSAVDPAHLHLVDDAIEATRGYAAANNGVAPARYAAMTASDRDAATAALARLLLHLDAIGPGADRSAHLVARHHALGALRVDEHMRELLELGDPGRPAVVTSSRDVYQAETVRLLRKLHGRDARIVLMLHNAHAQRVPMQLLPGVRARSAGSYLTAELGSDYVVLGVTAREGRTTDVRLDERAPRGFEVFSRPLGPPAVDSVERAVEECGPVLLDLRSARGTAGPSSIRYVTTHMALDVAEAFDALACLPTMSPSAFVLRA
jgi:erythromycin esterase